MAIFLVSSKNIVIFFKKNKVGKLFSAATYIIAQEMCQR